MAATREVSLFVLLLSCWHEAELQPIKMSSVSRSELPSNLTNLDDDVSTLVDEILIQEMLEPNKSGAETYRTAATLSMRLFKEKKARIKMLDQTDTNKHHEKEFFSGNEDRLSFNEEEKETIYQIKSLEALEKIIANLRRALGKHLKQKRKKHKSLFKGVKQHKKKESLNQETKTT